MISPSTPPKLHVVDVPFSDHSLVKCDLKTDVGFTPRPVRESRNLRKIDINAFRQDISSRPFDRVHDLSEVNDMWEFWLEQFLSALDSHAPLCRRRPRNKKSVPWMNAELLRLIARRRKFHKAYIRQSRSAEAYALFSRARAEAHNFNRQLKSEYFLNQCSMHSRDPRQMWRVMNTVTGRQRKSTDPACSTHSIAQVFQEIVTDQTRPGTLGLNLGPSPSATPFSVFCPIQEEKVELLLNKINPSKATGSDGVPGMLLKACADLLAPSLTAIINTSLATGCVPSLMKIAHVSPLHKGGDPSEPKNYRPVLTSSIGFEDTRENCS